jgi:hypothetical protein
LEVEQPPQKSASITEKLFNPRGSKSKEKRQSSYGSLKPDVPKADQPQVQPMDAPKKAESTPTREEKKKRRLSLWGK